MIRYPAFHVDSVRHYPVKLDFRLGVAHSLAARHYSENVITELVSSTGTAGYGEGVPRSYVTGETTESAATVLAVLTAGLPGQGFEKPDDILRYLTSLAATPAGNRNPAAVCSLETALLDCAGKYWNIPVSEILGFHGCPVSSLRYSMVVPLLDYDRLAGFLEITEPYGFRNYKVKVDSVDPARRVRTVRESVGSDVEIRVDANCSWSLGDARRFIAVMEELGVVSVEQPLAAGDFDGMAELRSMGVAAITLDESVCNAADVERAAASGACDIVNVRISKCGGMLGAMRVIEAAGKAGIGIQLGAQVGESCVLSAAGAHLASMTPSFRWLEGCFGRHLLVDDLCAEDVRFGLEGRLTLPTGTGLGITVDVSRLEDARRRYTDNRSA